MSENIKSYSFYFRLCFVKEEEGLIVIAIPTCSIHPHLKLEKTEKGYFCPECNTEALPQELVKEGEKLLRSKGILLYQDIIDCINALKGKGGKENV